MNRENKVEQIDEWMSYEDMDNRRQRYGNNRHEDEEDISWRLTAIIEGQGGQVFRGEMIALELGLTESYVHSLLKRHPLVEHLGRRSYKSLAEPIPPTIEGMIEIQSSGTIIDLGHQARADFADLVRQRSQNIRGRRKVMRRY